MNGWRLIALPDGTYALIHTPSQWWLAGFDSKADAGFWLQTYLLGVHEMAARHERKRERILAQMPVHGKVS